MKVEPKPVPTPGGVLRCQLGFGCLAGQGMGLYVEEWLDVTGDLLQAGPGRHLTVTVPGGEGQQTLLQNCRLPATLSVWRKNMCQD